MTLTGKQRRQLKSRGQTLQDDCSMGKAGLTEPFVAHVNRLLSERELIKLRFADVEGSDRKQLASEVSTAVEAECVGVVGRTILLYRANPKLEPKHRVLL